MDLIHWIAAAIVVAIGAGMATVEARRVWKRRMDAVDAHVMIGSAMERQGITPADAAAAGLESDLSGATRRCRECALTEECRARLSTLIQRPLPAGCPNAALFEAIERHQAVMEEQRNRSTADELGYLAVPLMLPTADGPAPRNHS